MLLLADGTNLLVRSLYVPGSAELTTTDRVVTGPLLIFINQLSSYVRSVRPNKVVVCWDGGKSNYRLGLYPDYKNGRVPPPAEFEDLKYSSWMLAKEFLALAGIYHMRMAGIEADDLIASYWRNSSDTKYIVSGDKDFFQLIDDNTAIYRPGNNKPYTCMSLALDMGCKPENIPHVMALTGDSVDDIKGVPGFGTKTAVKFLSKYQWDFDELLRARESKLIGYEERARMNLKLVDLRSPLPGLELVDPPPFQPTVETSFMWKHLLAFCEKYELRSIERQLLNNTLWN